LSERPDESSQGYPEEQPPGADPGDGSPKPREGAKAPRKHDDQSDDTDQTATGNRRSAG
jgi:hypothetical protein